MGVRWRFCCPETPLSAAPPQRELPDSSWGTAMPPLPTSDSDGVIRPVAAWKSASRLMLASARSVVIAARPWQANREYVPDDTSHQRNTHIVEIHQVWHPWHPWCGRAVKVRARLVKRGVTVAHCSSEDVYPHRLLELPLWMLDSAVCRNMRAAKPGSVSVESMRELKHILHLVQRGPGGLANEGEHQYWLNAGGADVNVATQAPRTVQKLEHPENNGL